MLTRQSIARQLLFTPWLTRQSPLVFSSFRCFARGKAKPAEEVEEAQIFTEAGAPIEGGKKRSLEKEQDFQ